MRYPTRRRGCMPVAVLFVCLWCPITFAQTDAYWLNPVDGDWGTASNWSTDSVFPNNGSPTAADTYDVTLDATGAAYTVTLDTDIALNSLTLNSADLTLATYQDMDIAGALDIQAGTLRLINGTLRLGAGDPVSMPDMLGTLFRSGGRLVLDGTLIEPDGVFTIDSTYGSIELGASARIVNQTITTAPGYHLAAAETGALIEDSVIEGTASVRAGVTLELSNTELAAGSTISLEGDASGYATLDIYNLTGAGEIVFNGSDNANRFAGFGDLGEGLTIRTGTTGARLEKAWNHGHVVIDNPDATVYFGRDFYNSGLITMSAGTLVLDGSDDYFSQLETYQLGDIQVAGGRVLLTAQNFHLSDDLDLDKLGPVEVFDGVRMYGGDIVSTGANELIIRGNVEAQDVLIDADVRVEAGGQLAYGTIADGRRLTLVGNAGAVASSFAPTAGETVFDGSDNANRVSLAHGPVGLGHDGTIRTGTTGGVISAWSIGNNYGSIIADTPGATVTIKGSGSFVNWGLIEVGEGAEVSIESPIPVFDSPLYQQNSGGTLRLLGGAVSSQYQFGIIHGAIEGYGQLIGDVLLTRNGVIAPGASVGRISIDGDLSVLASTTAVKIELGGTTAGSEHDQLAITGDVALGGTLEVSLHDGHVPNAGDVFEIVTYGGQRTGRFDSIDLSGVGPLGDLALAVLYDDDFGGVDGSVIVRASLIGDANVDNHVDIADLVLLSQNYSRTADASWADGDFNQDGSVDIADLVLLSQHYSQSVIVGLVARSTPEPGAFGGMVMMIFGYNRRRHTHEKRRLRGV